MDKNMKNLINKIKNLTLEQINKNLIFVAILSLFFRLGSFTAKSTPNPFELILILIIILTMIDVIKNKKIKEFFFCIPRNIRIALSLLVASIFIGWGVSILRGIPTTYNMILEFGNFVFSVSIFLLIIFYTRNDKKYIKWYLYALLIPIVYIICIIFPNIANHLNLTEGNIKFIGLTTNPNIVSKFLLVPIVFFLILIFKNKNKIISFVYFFISSSLISLLFWTASRGAILSLILSMILIFSVFTFNELNWKKLLTNIFVFIFILTFAFILTPGKGKQLFLYRSLNLDNYQSGYGQLKDKSIINIIKESSFGKKIISEKHQKNNIIVENNQSSETRIEIWSFYLKKVLMNPFGFGPNTHLPSNIPSRDGGYLKPGPHNSYIQIWLWGGLLGLFSFIFILISVIYNFRNKIKSNFDYINLSIFCILIALLISMFFDDSFQLLCFWISLSLYLSYESNTQN